MTEVCNYDSNVKYAFDIVREVRYVVELRNDECVCFYRRVSRSRYLDRAVDTALGGCFK